MPVFRSIALYSFTWNGKWNCIALCNQKSFCPCHWWATLTMVGDGGQCWAKAHQSWSVNKFFFIKNAYGSKERVSWKVSYLFHWDCKSNGMSVCFYQQPLGCLSCASSTSTEHLTLMRMRKRTRQDMFCEILHASVALDHEQKAWRANMTNSMDKERGQEKCPRVPGEGNAPLSQTANPNAANLGWVQNPQTLDPLQSLENSIIAAYYTPCNIPSGIMGCILILSTPCWETGRKTSFTYTDLCVPQLVHV